MIDLSAFADELETSLYRDLVRHWFPRCIDPGGGFHQSFDREWSLGQDKTRAIVYQSRLVWVASTLQEEHPGEYIEYARHGFRFLVERMLQDGSFVWWLGEEDKPFRQHPDQRVTYGVSFALFALSAAARVGVEGALEAAMSAFEWLETHCHDNEFGGYLEVTERDGTPVVLPIDENATRRDGIANPYGLKTQNTHLHLMEAFSELYRVWQDERVKARIGELIGMLIGPFRFPGGQSAQTLYRDLRHATDTISYGHDIENAHLLIDSARRIGDQPPLDVAARLADYVLEEGWDRAHGGLFYVGRPGGTVVNARKSWWVMAEAILGFLTVFREVGDPRYLQAAYDLWRYTDARLVDHAYGGWYGELSQEGAILDDRKGHAWKAFYHETRALLYSARLLRAMSS